MHNKVNAEIKQAFYYFYIKTNLANLMANCIKTWQVINELTSHQSGTSSVKELSLNGVSMTNSTALSNAFDDHFSTIGRKLRLAKYL